MNDESLTLERAVAQFVVNFGSRDLDSVSRDAVKKLIKDQLAVQVGASRLPWSKQVREFRKPRPGGSTIVGESTKAAAADAAYLNATYGHGFEYDDFIGNARRTLARGETWSNSRAGRLDGVQMPSYYSCCKHSW
jgi:2-methylcitrate dehydratase PrpD